MFFLENMTKDRVAILTGILEHFNFPQEKYELQPPLRPITVYSLTQVTQAILSKMYTDTFEVHDKYSPISHYLFNPVPIYDVTQLSIVPPAKISSQTNKIDPKWHPLLHKSNFTYCQFPSQEVFKLMQMLCEIQDGYSQHKNVLGVVDMPFHITHRPAAELNRQRITKVPIHYRDQTQHFLDDLDYNGIIKRIGVNDAKNVEFGSKFIYPIIILPKSDIFEIVLL